MSAKAGVGDKPVLFADDTALLANSEEKLCKLLKSLLVCGTTKMRANVGKYKITRCSMYVNVGRSDVRLEAVNYCFQV